MVYWSPGIGNDGLSPGSWDYRHRGDMAASRQSNEEKWPGFTSLPHLLVISPSCCLKLALSHLIGDAGNAAFRSHPWRYRADKGRMRTVSVDK